MMDFPWIKSLILVCGTAAESDKVHDIVEKIRDAAPWTELGSLKEAGSAIIVRDEMSPTEAATLSERQHHWSDDVNIVVLDGPIGYDVDPITLLGLSHIADKGMEVGVCAVAGLIWEGESPWSRQIRPNGSQDLMSLVLSDSLLLSCDQADVIIEEMRRIGQ